MPALGQHPGWDAEFRALLKKLHGARPKRPQPKATRPVELDLSGIPKREQAFCAGVLALPSCPRTPVAIRKYLQLFLDARAQLAKFDGTQPVLVGRGKPRRRTASVPNRGDIEE